MSEHAALDTPRVTEKDRESSDCRRDARVGEDGMHNLRRSSLCVCVCVHVCLCACVKRTAT